VATSFRVIGRVALFVLLFTALMSWDPPASSAKEHLYPAWVGTRTVTYCRPDGLSLAMTLFAPSKPSDVPVPVVLQVHGGGWVRGHRFTALSQSPAATLLTERGIAVASIDYRLAPASPWPAQIIDVECAVRYLRTTAEVLGLDPNQIGAWGSSAGGQLVALLGTTADQSLWGQTPRAPRPAVQAVADQFGPTDLAAALPRWTAGIVHRVFGSSTGASQALDDASPLDHVGPGDPPFLIQQGTSDAIVPETQSFQLAGRLRAAGDSVRLTLVAGGNHGLTAVGEAPDSAWLDQELTDFFVHTLTHNRN
jgi:acetyl esterase/lipase